MSDRSLDNLLKFDIEPHPDGFYAATSILGAVTREFYNVRAAMTEKAIREKMIELGWTPPPEPRP